MTIRTHTQLLEQPLALVEDRGEMRTLVRIDPDREHHQPPKCDGYVTPRRADLKRVECPILFRATPQPSTGKRSVRSKANPNTRRQGILETTHQRPTPYEHKRSRSHDHHHSRQYAPLRDVLLALYVTKAYGEATKWRVQMKASSGKCSTFPRMQCGSTRSARSRSRRFVRGSPFARRPLHVASEVAQL